MVKLKDSWVVILLNRNWQELEMKMAMPLNVKMYHRGYFIKDPKLRCANGKLEMFPAPIEDIHVGRREELGDRGGGQCNENISDNDVIHSPDLDEVDINDGFDIHENYEVDPLNEELLSVRDKINHKVLEDNVDDGSDFNDEVVEVK
ncbi:hypothetical protein GH714_034206 [Hevea brasiliensis]|uniref:Uncharacterized protein n=1 Tax=Hevea brasiliensis TaxID=3981 RepID=A0A6A6K985_HEVBR|nr:hypothetical protein GH714_034206 [Hevea brasiliensis]